MTLTMWSGWAAKYDIDVYGYCYLKNFVHPDDPNARETFDRTYGDLFRAIPGLKGMVFVGESVQFPTKDPNACPLHHTVQPEDGIPDRRPRSCWWPCYDYIDWISMARDSIRAVNPDADVVLWTYNWGRQPLEPRVALLERLPKDISLLVTFEMYDLLDLGNSVGKVNFRKLPGALRSNQATHSVASIGKYASYLTETHGQTGHRYGVCTFGLLTHSCFSFAKNKAIRLQPPVVIK